MSDGHRHPRTRLSRVSHRVVAWVASASAGIFAVVAVLLWLVTAAATGFPEELSTLLWSVTGAVTFVMVFLIQHAADRQSRAILVKLDELIRIHSEARDDLVAVERRPVVEQDEIEDDMAVQHGQSSAEHSART